MVELMTLGNCQCVGALPYRSRGLSALNGKTVRIGRKMDQLRETRAGLLESRAPLVDTR